MSGGVSASTIAIGSLAATAVSAGVSAYGAMEQGQAQAAAANYQAQVARNAAIQAQDNSEYAIQAGSIQVQQSQMQTAQASAKVRAAEASNGFDINTGSALDLQASTADVGAQDAGTIRNNALRTAYGYQVQGAGFSSQAGLDSAQASQASTAGAFGTASSILGGASALGNQYAGFTKAGVFSSTPNAFTTGNLPQLKTSVDPLTGQLY